MYFHNSIRGYFFRKKNMVDPIATIIKLKAKYFFIFLKHVLNYFLLACLIRIDACLN